MTDSAATLAWASASARLASSSVLILFAPFSFGRAKRCRCSVIPRCRRLLDGEQPLVDDVPVLRDQVVALLLGVQLGVLVLARLAQVPVGVGVVRHATRLAVLDVPPPAPVAEGRRPVPATPLHLVGQVLV